MEIAVDGARACPPHPCSLSSNLVRDEKGGDSRSTLEASLEAWVQPRGLHVLLSALGSSKQFPSTQTCAKGYPPLIFR